MARTLVVLATYDEAENIRPIVEAILGIKIPELDILVVDDNSPDGTGQIAADLAREHSEVKVVHRKGKLGLGSAQCGGMEIAMLQGYDYVVTMDADFSHNPKYLKDLLAKMDDCDLAIGSRYVPGGATENWGLVRRLMSWGANAFVRLLLGLEAHDCSSGFKCYRIETLRRIDLSQIVAKGYAFQEEMVYRFQLLGARIGEVPILFENRRLGKTKMSLREIAGLFTTVLRLRWRTRGHARAREREE